MRISTTACYALHLLLSLADVRHDHAPVSASELASMTGISEKFTQKILRLLNTAGLVRSIRGIAGGYLLSVPAESITLAAIIRAVEGGFVPPSVQEGGGPTGCKACNTWENALHSLEATLELFTLQSVMASTSCGGSSSHCPHSTNSPCAAATQGDGINLNGGFNAKTSSLGRQRSRKYRSAGPDTTAA